MREGGGNASAAIVHCSSSYEKLNNLRNGSLRLSFDPPYARHSILIGFLWKFSSKNFFPTEHNFSVILVDDVLQRKQSLPEGKKNVSVVTMKVFPSLLYIFIYFLFIEQCAIDK